MKRHFFVYRTLCKENDEMGHLKTFDKLVKNNTGSLRLENMLCICIFPAMHPGVSSPMNGYTVAVDGAWLLR